MVHNGAMKANDTVRQSVTLPSKIAGQIRSMAKKRRLSANRVLVELVEEGSRRESRKRKRSMISQNAFRSTTNPEEAVRLGDQMGRMVFGE
jgi:hypothetical protein